MREKLNISEEQLRDCLRRDYRLSVVALEFLPLGLDTNAGVYRVTSAEGASYLLKVKRGTFYEPSCLVPGYLRDQGVASVVAPLTTNANTLWTRMGEWTVILYPFIDRDSGKSLGMTEGNWRDVGRTLRQVHQVALPPEGFRSLREETFDPSEYDRSVRMLTQHVRTEGRNPPEEALRVCWVTHQPRIDAMMTAMNELAGALQSQSGPKVICHADFHTNNIMRDSADRIFVIDWDDVKLAPKERDFIFVKEIRSTRPALHAPSPFFQGYGETAIDWRALTYYRCERLIQDVIEDAQQLFFRDDLGEEVKAAAARLFQVNVESNEFDAAVVAATHLRSRPPRM